MTVFPDTNVVLRYLLGDIPAQFKAASALFEKIHGGVSRAVILEGVIVECVHVLTKFYQVPRAETAEKLMSLLRYKGIVNRDRDEFAGALKLYSDSGLDNVDCILCVKSKGPERLLFTFDEKLKRMAKKG